MKVAVRLYKDRELDVIQVKVFKSKEVADTIDGYDDFYSQTIECDVLDNIILTKTMDCESK